MQEEENMAGRTTPDFSKRPEEQPLAKTEAASQGTIVKSDTQGNIEIKPAAVGDERTLQIVIIALTLIALVTIGVSTYNSAIDAQTIVASVISGMAGLLGGQALRK